MYVCGITVYDYCHIGHARMLIVFDVVRRHLRASGYRVTFVRNITDIDDKIIKRAAENGEPIGALTERFIARDTTRTARRSASLRADHEPRATEHIPEIIAMIAALIERGYAYVGGERRRALLGRAASRDYGQLSGKRLDGPARRRARRGRRGKRDPLDFVLWKARQARRARAGSRPGARAGPAGTSSARRCRRRCLGDALRHPRRRHGPEVPAPRERDRADLRGLRARRSCNVWMHNGFVNVDDEKMSKSLGNFFTVRDVLERGARSGGHALLPARAATTAGRSTTRSDSLDAGRRGAERLYLALRGVRAGAGAPRRRRRSASSRRWTTTSIRRRRSRSCSRWRARSIPRRRRAASNEAASRGGRVA